MGQLASKRSTKGKETIRSACRFELRAATTADIDEMNRIAEAGKKLLKDRGIDQWQKGNYPNKETFIRDVELGTGYVFLVNDRIAGICALTFDGEPAYDRIEGKWLTGDQLTGQDKKVHYAVAHQGAMAPEFQGKHLTGEWFAAIARFAKEHGAKSVRIDTHERNVAMRRAFEGAGFKYCGVVYLHGGDCDGDSRAAYELTL